MRIYWLLLLSLCQFLLYSCKEDLTKLTAEELDNYISEVEVVLDSLKTLKSKLHVKESGQFFSQAKVDESILELNAKDSSVIIKGKIEEDTVYQKLQLVLKKPYQKDFNEKIVIEADGSFFSEFQIEKTAIYKLKYGKETFDLFLSPGNTIGTIINVNHKNKIRTVGDLQNENTFLNADRSYVVEGIKELDQFDLNGEESSATSLQHKQEEILNALNAELDSYSGPLSEQFKDLYNSKVKFTCALSILSKAVDANEDVAEDIHSFDIFDSASEDYFVLEEFRKYIFNLFEHKSSILVGQEEIPVNTINYFDYKYNLATSLFSSTLIREFIKTDVVYSAIAKLNHAGVNPLVQKFKKDISSGPFQYSVERRYKSLVKPRNGTLAPELTGETFEGNKFRLSDYRGKYVYIFSWATWCGPCKVEIPFYERMHEDYSDENIVFIGVSVDKDKNKWRESFFYNEYPGIQVLIPGDWNSAFVKDYGVTSIPQFVLVDPNGIILEVNAERPTKNIKAQLSQYGIFARQT